MNQLSCHMQGSAVSCTSGKRRASYDILLQDKVVIKGPDAMVKTIEDFFFASESADKNCQQIEHQGQSSHPSVSNGRAPCCV